MGGARPAFEVWTGPAFEFDAAGDASADVSRCNTHYRIDIANDPDFSVNLVKSAEKTADDCRGQWQPTAEQWRKVFRKNRVYYRVHTYKKEADGTRFSRQISTKPADNFREIPPPYAILKPLVVIVTDPPR